MAIREIVLYPDAPLRQKAKPVIRFDAEFQRLVADMFETMSEKDGVGLAAPQIGISRRFLVFHDPDTDRKMCLVNPEIVEQRGSETSDEGCLSLGSMIYAPVPRATWVHVRAQDNRGNPLDFEATDLMARIIQHEADHLDGLVFLDRVDILTRESKLREWQVARLEMKDSDALSEELVPDSPTKRSVS